MTLGEKQRLFTKLVASLIQHVAWKKYGCTFGETYRTPEQAAINAAKGSGIKNSLHTKRLAIDLNLFDEAGNYLTDSEAYRWLGEWWEQCSGDGYACCWGGRFSKPDGNHFSIEHEGVK